VPSATRTTPVPRITARCARGRSMRMVSRLALNAVPGTAHVPATGVAALHRTLYAALPELRGGVPLTDALLALLQDVARDITQGWRRQA